MSLKPIPIAAMVLGYTLAVRGDGARGRHHLFDQARRAARARSASRPGCGQGFARQEMDDCGRQSVAAGTGAHPADARETYDGVLALKDAAQPEHDPNVAGFACDLAADDLADVDITEPTVLLIGEWLHLKLPPQ